MEPSSPIPQLPVELIDLIAKHARTRHLQLHPFPTPRRKARCACLPAQKPGYYDDFDRLYGYAVPEQKWWEADGVLALSMTCKRLWRVMFEEKGNRSVAVGLCERQKELARGVSQTLRKNVKTLCIVTHPFHAPPRSSLSLNEYLPLFPSAHKLVVNWHFRLANTPATLPPFPTHVPWNDVTSLVVNFGKPEKCDRRTDVHPLPLMDELSDILNHLFLPSLSRITLYLDFGDAYSPLDLETYSFPDNAAGWALLTNRLGAVRKFEELEEVVVKVRFEGDHPPEVNYWTVMERIGLEILPDSQIQSLALHLNFYFPPHESTEWIFSVENADMVADDDWNSEEGFVDRDRAEPPSITLPAKYIPHEEDLDLILDALRDAHPTLDRFLLSIEGSVTSPHEGETTRHLLDFTYTRHQAKDDSREAKNVVQYRRRDQGIAALYSDIVEATEKAFEYEQAIDAEVMWQMYGAY